MKNVYRGLTDELLNKELESLKQELQEAIDVDSGINIYLVVARLRDAQLEEAKRKERKNGKV